MLRFLTAILLLATFTSVLSAPVAPTTQSGCQAFPETGKSLCGRFLQYWQEHGGLAQQGYPISGEFAELSDTDGKTYRVQYFERAVFEFHPENQAPYDVLLSLLGQEEFTRNYPNGIQTPAPPVTPDSSAPFDVTGKRISGAFRAYFLANGGVAQQGYPISDPLTETVTPGTKPILVQYFERARFELHPEIGATPTVLLSRLGAERFESRYAYGEPVAGDVWSTLRARPLKLPTMSSGASCSADTASTVNPGFGLALGSGPAYPVGFNTDGTYNFSGTNQEGLWYNLKVLWTADPARYTGPILVRGHQIDGSNELRFASGANPSTELHLDASNANAGASVVDWPDWPSYTRLSAPGCYAYQIDGTNFTKVLVFQAINK